MKKIFYKIMVLTLVIGSTTSCDDQLDQLPFDEFATENAYVTSADFENAIRGVYAGLTFGSMYGGSDGGSMLTTPDVLADNVTISQFGRTTESIIHNWRYTPDNLGFNLYASAYSLIFRANQLLFYAESFEGENKANIVAEAKALRALAHFDIVSYYGKIPTQSGDANGSLGIAYVTSIDPNQEPARETVGATYDKIVQDLTEALADINDTNPAGRMGKESVSLLLSRVYLYMGQWQNAINAANNVTTPVAPRADVVDVWEDASRAGLLFYIPNESGTLGNGIGVAWSQGSKNNLIPEYVVSFELYNFFAADDIRKDAYTFQGTANGNPVNGIKKLFGRAGKSDGVVDYKILRAAEAQLNKAEAYFNLGNEGAARTALDLVRTKRYTTPPSGETGTALRDAIRLERRLEFAFEYQRFFDIKRWGLGVSRTGAGDLADGTGTPSEVLNLPAGNFKFQLPIGRGTLDTNPNIVQNPGY